MNKETKQALLKPVVDFIKGREALTSAVELWAFRDLMNRSYENEFMRTGPIRAAHHSHEMKLLWDVLKKELDEFSLIKVNALAFEKHKSGLDVTTEKFRNKMDIDTCKSWLPTSHRRSVGLLIAGPSCGYVEWMHLYLMTRKKASHSLRDNLHLQFERERERGHIGLDDAPVAIEFSEE